MNDIDRVSIVAKDGKAEILTGKAHVQLNDYSSQQFNTKKLEDFVKYVNDYDTMDEPVFVSNQSCELWDEDFDRSNVPCARVELEKTKFMDVLTTLVTNDTIPLENLEKVLHSLLDYGDANVLTLYKFTRNCNIATVSEFQRQVDDAGNYHLLVKREGRGDQKIRPVELITFTMPVLKYHVETFAFPFKVSMDYKVDNGMKVYFKLTNYQLDEMIENAITLLVKTYLDKITNGRKVYYGKKTIIKADDSWKFKVL